MADARTQVHEVDILVLGAGPAGMGAAVTAARSGARVVVLDEAPHAGGQVYRAPFDAGRAQTPAESPEAAEGTRQRAELAASGAQLVSGHRVWLVTERFDVESLGPKGPARWRAPRLIAATGTHERVIPFPGWTLPGVVGLAATTVLMKEQRMAPGRRVLVAGCGPLLASVAAGLSKMGADVVAVADLATPGDWARALPRMLGRPDLLLRGAGWAGRIAARGIPYLPRYHVVGAARAQSDGPLQVTLARLGHDGNPGAERVIEADALAVGHGLVPGTELTRLLRAEHAWRPARGGWVPVRDAQFQTTVPGLHVVGDGGGISGAAAAWHQGRLAGLAAAHAAGIGDARILSDQIALESRPLRIAERFGQAMGEMMVPRRALYAAIPPATQICRCEEVTAAELVAAVDAGAREVNQVKHWTRCGMGPCQGRMCGDAAAEIICARRGGVGRAEVGLWTGRAPLRPVPLDALAGTFDYADIPIPAPAPL